MDIQANRDSDLGPVGHDHRKHDRILPNLVDDRHFQSISKDESARIRCSLICCVRKIDKYALSVAHACYSLRPVVVRHQGMKIFVVLAGRRPL